MSSVESHPERNIIRVQLRQNIVLKEMSEVAHAELESQLVVVDCHKGDPLLHQGVHEMEQYFILDGILKRVVANQQAKVAVAAIIQLLKGEAVSANPLVMNTCYSFVTARDAVHVASVHQYDATDKTFKAVPGSGGVSSAANQVEGRYALSWAENIWADMLAL